MCGISGIIHYKSSDKEQEAVRQSVANMQYRGPDCSDYYYDDVACFGHVRLAIIDINPRSNQPFHSRCGRYVIIYNGEAYNFQEVRSQMLAEGTVFRSESDTEVLLEGFIKYGPEILTRLRGMWAFVIWDKQDQKAFIARDRFGEKPFYYQWREEEKRLCFASNLAAIRPLVSGELSIDPDAVRQLLNYQFIVQDKCIYKHIQKLPPAHYAWVSSQGVDMHSYWQPDYRSKHGKSYSEMKIEARELLISSIEGQLIADVPVGLFLSGGVDSGVIAGIASRIKKDLMAVTMTVPGNEQYNEEDNAAKVANHCGLIHHKVPLDESCINILPKVLATMEPLADSSLIPSSYVAEYAGRHLKVMLSGDGGDELFGGYGIPLKYLNAVKTGAGTFADGVILQSIKKAYTPGFKYIAERMDATRLFRRASLSTFFQKNFFPYDLQQHLFKAGVSSSNESVEGFYQQSKAFTSNTEDAFMWVGIQTKMVDDFLFKMDSANMLSSVESRAPFLDHRIAELTSGANIQDLMPDGIDKQLLKEIGEEFIPKEVLYDQKKGFALPIKDFLNRKWITSLEQMAAEGLSSDAGIFDPAGIRYIIALYRKKPGQPLARVLYSILVFEIWLRVFHLEMDADEVAEKYL
ncbi:MAG: asparagine synthase (glutamine-hydrolyzing) [Chitinophagaceae bacterium]